MVSDSVYEAVCQQREQWETEAQRYAQNADYWRERAEQAEQLLAAIYAAAQEDQPDEGKPEFARRIMRMIRP
jgi:hypothetical protein